MKSNKYNFNDIIKFTLDKIGPKHLKYRVLEQDNRIVRGDLRYDNAEGDCSIRSYSRPEIKLEPLQVYVRGTRPRSDDHIVRCKFRSKKLRDEYHDKILKALEEFAYKNFGLQKEKTHTQIDIERDLEERINDEICVTKHLAVRGEVKDWPTHERGSYISKIPYSISNLKHGNLNRALSHLKIDMMILNTDPYECELMCGNIRYIKECKRWMNNNNFKQVWAEQYEINKRRQS